MKLSSEPNADSADVDFIANHIYEFNMSTANDRNYYPLRIFIRDDDSKIVGGIVGDMWGGWLHITFLWVAPELRKQGYGKRLLLAAETEAKAKNCRGIFLETHGFQAPDFYRKQGYQLVGQLHDYPQDYQYFIFWKSTH